MWEKTEQFKALQDEQFIYYKLAELQFKHEPGEESHIDVKTIADKYKLSTDEVYRIAGKGSNENWPTPEYPLEEKLKGL